MESTKCPSHNSETIKIKPLGFTEEVEVVLNFICECECSKGGVPNSKDCHNGNGTLECGACKYVGWYPELTASTLLGYARLSSTCIVAVRLNAS